MVQVAVAAQSDEVKQRGPLGVGVSHALRDIPSGVAQVVPATHSESPLQGEPVPPFGESQSPMPGHQSSAFEHTNGVLHSELLPQSEPNVPGTRHLGC